MASCFEQCKGPSGYIKCDVIYVHLIVSQKFLASGAQLTWKINTDAHILAHMYIECPVDK